MSIDLDNETICTLSEAAAGLDLHVSTLHRWRLRGIKGIRLETCRIGGRRVTSREAVQRFNEQVTAVADGASVPRTESSVAREKRLQRVERELEAAGI